MSGFTGGLINSQTTTPAANFDIELTNENIKVIAKSLSEEIPSKDITIILTKSGQTRTLMPSVSTVPFGFNIVEAGKGFHDYANVSEARENPTTISMTNAANSSNSVQWFGNYTLKTGSIMSASKDAFTDVCNGTITLPDYLGGKASWSKSELLTIDRTVWEKIFDQNPGTLTDLGKTDNVLKINSGAEIANADLADYLIGKGLAELKDTKNVTKNNLYASTTDPNWTFGSTCTYGDGGGQISIASGDRVTVTIVYTPSGQTLFTKTVTVKRA